MHAPDLARPCASGRMRGGVPGPQDGVALGGSRIGRHRWARRIRNRALQQPHQTPPQRITWPASDRSLAYSSTPSIPDGAHRPAPLAQPNRQIELGAPRAIGCGRISSPAKSRSEATSASNASITWNSGCRDSDRAGLSTSTSRSNGRSCMRIGRKVAGPHPPDQFLEARIARRVRPQHERLTKNPTVIQRAVGAPRDRAADCDVVARAKPRQQRRCGHGGAGVPLVRPGPRAARDPPRAAAGRCAGAHLEQSGPGRSAAGAAGGAARAGRAAPAAPRAGVGAPVSNGRRCLRRSSSSGSRSSSSSPPTIFATGSVRRRSSRRWRVPTERSCSGRCASSSAGFRSRSRSGT